MLMLHGAQLQRNQTSEIMEVVIRHREFRMVERLLELGVDPKLVTLEMGDTPLHAALSIALDKDKGWSCRLVYVEKGHTHPSHCSGHGSGQEEWSGVLCVVYVEKATCPSPLSGHCSRQGKWSGVLCLLCALFMWREVAHGHCSGHAPCDL